MLRDMWVSPIDFIDTADSALPNLIRNTDSDVDISTLLLNCLPDGRKYRLTPALTPLAQASENSIPEYN